MKKITLVIMFMMSTCIFAQSTSWSENKLKEYWKTHRASEIEGVYIRTREIVSYNGFGTPKTYPDVISEAEFFIVNDGEKLVMGSFLQDFYGTIIQTTGSNKYFLQTDLKYWGLNSSKRTIVMYLEESGELELNEVEYVEEKKVNGISYTMKAIFTDTFSKVYKP